MARKKLELKRIENAASREVTYRKRKEVMVKKAHELSVLCDTDVGFIMFSPTGELNTFASNGTRVEDIFLRLVDGPDFLRGGPIQNEAFLSERLKQLKTEAKMLEKIEIIQGLEEKLAKLDNRKREIQGKLRCYRPNVDQFKTVLEAESHQRFLANAIQRIQMAKATLLGHQDIGQSSQNPEAVMVNKADATITNEQPADSNQNSNPAGDEARPGASLPAGCHLSLSFIQAQKQWTTVGCELAQKPNGH